MKEKKESIVLTVCLNGTDTNPYLKMGLTQNPFPQVGKAEYVDAEMQVNKLGGPHIPQDRAAEYIRETLKGFSQEFIDLCVRKFKPGRYVKFNVHFNM